MFGASALAVLVATTAVLTWPSATSNVRAPTAAPFRALRSIATRPSIVENGTDLVLFPAPSVRTTVGSVAFSPQGVAYFQQDTYYVTRFNPDGTYKKIYVNHLTQYSQNQTLYLDGSVWTTARTGVIKLNPVSFQSRYFELGAAVSGIAIGTGGAVYATAGPTDGNSATIYRIDPSGGVTGVPVPVRLLGNLAVGPDGLLYSSYIDYTGGTFGFVRLNNDGTSTELPIPGYTLGPNGTPQFGPILPGKGYLYFNMTVYDPPAVYTTGYFGRIAPGGVISRIALPGGEITHGYGLAGDRGGNLWMSLSFNEAFSAPSGLYQYNTYTGHFNGPLEPAVTNQIPQMSGLSGGPYVGADDNVWFFTGQTFGSIQSFGAYVRHVQTLEPANLSVTAARPASFTILETQANGPWTAASTKPSVATVSPALSTTGDFTVRETGPGIASIAVKDKLGNLSYELIAAQ